MKPVVHAIAGTTAMLSIATFWASTLVSELFMDQASVIIVKHSIAVYGLVVLAALMASTGGTGHRLARDRTGQLLVQKKKRMPIIARNGLLVMIPSAIFLNLKASAGEFDWQFYTIQGVELMVGLVQLTLMGMNFRDGLGLAGRLSK